MNKYQLSLCGYEKKNQHSKRGRVGGDTHDDCCGNVAFRGTGCRETTVAVGGEIVAGWQLFSVDGYICRCSTGNDEACGGDVSGCSSRSCSLVSYFWEFSWIVCF